MLLFQYATELFSKMIVTGDWHDNEDACYDDARNHRKLRKSHYESLTEQTLSRRINLG